VAEVVTGDAVVDIPCARFPSRLLALLLDLLTEAVILGIPGILAAVTVAAGSRLEAASGAAVGLTAVILVIAGYPGDLFAGTFVIQERLPARRALPAVLTVRRDREHARLAALGAPLRDTAAIRR
jgi:hypothetical protein